MIKNLALGILLVTAMGFANAGLKAESAVFVGDYFWRVVGIFEHVKGVSEVISGYGSSKLVKPTYVTQISALDHFYRAESYHQKYLANYVAQPHIFLNHLPKLVALKERFLRFYL